jgi:hypothetical protein
VKVVERGDAVGALAGISAEPGGDTVNIAAEPLIMLVEPELDRWIEIIDANGRLITVIEVLSPTNKSADGIEAYRRRRRTYRSGGVNFVEIDLLRRGLRVHAIPRDQLPTRARTPYLICVYRAADPEKRELYPAPLRERLPATRVPLRNTDRDVVLDLQPLVDQCFERGRYWLLDYRRDLEPPLPPEDAQWAEELMRNSGLR